jgi:hypothetical protein
MKMLRAIVRLGVVLATALVLAACDFSTLMPKEHVDFAKAVVMLVQNRDAEGLEAVADPVLWQQLSPELRERMAGMFPREPAISVGVSNYRSSSDGEVSNVTIVLVYRYPQRDVQAAVSFRSADHGFVLTAIHVSPAGTTPERPDSPDAARDM